MQSETQVYNFNMDMKCEIRDVQIAQTYHAISKIRSSRKLAVERGQANKSNAHRWILKNELLVVDFSALHNRTWATNFNVVKRLSA